MRSSLDAEWLWLRRSAVATVVAAVCGLLSSCSQRPTTLGAAVSGAPVPIRTALATNVEARVTLQGTMTTKCPVAGCWFMLSDASGTIKVDTKNAGFVVIDVPVSTKMTVSGRVVTNGNERLVEASGVAF